VGAVGAFLLMSACGGGSIDVSPPSPEASAAAACEALADNLPDTVQDGERRPTSPESELTAAWGNPEIVLRCGVPSPAAYEPTAQLVEVDGVEWFPEELERGYRFTTFGRSAFVEVVVPDRYQPEVNALVDLAPAVDAAVPAGQTSEEW
jgi:hypothetical protein